ncbi:polysaccharide biosynthesis tyrosine autokinase [Desulfococcus sp.]|uniref:polysaccharide biosynthesis tyrosine autokinase n=1 Tax=Desulfococcus sp. TaxID=2025834 RepID=UPI0035935EF1
MAKTYQALERFKKESRNGTARRPVEKPEVIHVDLEARQRSHGGVGVLEPFRPKQADPPAETAHEYAEIDRSPASEPSAFHDDSKIDRNLVSLLAPQSYEAEQIKLLKAQILYRTAGVIPSPMAVTSVLPGEGKSFIAANLAVSIAQELDRHVLLIDCDLRKPGVHRLFGFEDPPGLSEYLTNGMELADLLIRTKEKCLSILPAGALPPNPSELLSSKRMENLLLEVSTRYQDRIIILDTPPVAMTAEGNTLAQFVEAVLLVVKHNGTPKDQLKELVKRMGTEKILGVVLNNVEKYAQTYGRYRKYQGYYGKAEDRA